MSVHQPTNQMLISLYQAERNILEAVKHPFIVDLLYAFQVTIVCIDLGNANFLRLRENFI